MTPNAVFVGYHMNIRMGSGTAKGSPELPIPDQRGRWPIDSAVQWASRSMILEGVVIIQLLPHRKQQAVVGL